MTCVQCTTSEPGACSGATPACVSNQCQKCTAHAQGAMSNVCLPDGSCADGQQVAYVANGGSGTACTKASPCGLLDDGVKAGRPYVKVAAGTVTDTKTTTIDGRAVTILADPGAQISRSNAEVILTTGTHHLDFNTIAANLGPITIAVNTGVNCTTIGTPLVFDSNIIYGNAVNGGGQQLGGSPMCSASYSDVGPDPATGATNINATPMFVSAGQNNFHLMASSPAKDVADPAATLAEDIDGDVRPQGPRRDMGADEIKQ